MMKSIAIVSLALLGVSCLVSAQSNCQGAGYDLSSLAGQDYPGSDPLYTYQLSLCGQAKQADCASHGGNMCQYGKQAPYTYSHVLTKWDGSGAWSTCTDATKCPNGGFQVSFANGDGCGGTTGAARSVTYYFACTPGSTSTAYVMSNSGTTGCVYNAVFNHQIGCDGGSGSGGDDGGGKKGLSGGSIFLIILVVIVPVYVIVGCVYKRQKQGTSGMESCPNVDFWRDLPSLVADGFKFTFRKVGGLCGKSGDATYENVK